MSARLLASLTALFCAGVCYRLFVQPLRAVARQELGLAADGAAVLVALGMAAHTFRPLLGRAVDVAARRGIEPRWWLRLAAAQGIAAAVLSLLSTSPSAWVPAIALAVGCAVIVEVVTSASIAAEQARGARSSVLGSARTFALTAAALLAALSGAWIAESPRPRIGLMLATIVALVVCTSVMGGSGARPTDKDEVEDKILSGDARRSALLGFLFYTVPGFGTLLYYHQIGDLRFSQTAAGGLEALNNLAGLAGAVLYVGLRKRRPLPSALPAATAIYALSSAAYLAYPAGWVTAIAPADTSALPVGLRAAASVEAVNGVLAAVGFAAVSETAVRGAGAGGRAARMAFILCACNVGMSLSEWVGSMLATAGGLSLRTVILLHVACYFLLAVVLARRAPRWNWLGI